MDRFAALPRGVRLLVALVLAVPFLVPIINCGASGSLIGQGEHSPEPTPEFFSRAYATYVADTGNHRIVRIEGTSLPGSGWETFGSQGSGRGQFNNPSNVKIGSDYRIYIVDTGNNRIVRMDNMQGENWVEIAQGFNQPRDMDIGPDGAIYIADTGNNRIVRFDNMSGAGMKTLSTVGALGNLNAPWGVQFIRPTRENGFNFENILIADRGNNRVVLTRADLGAAGQRAYGRPDLQPGSGPGEYNQPTRITISLNYIGVLDTGNNRVSTITYAGAFVNEVRHGYSSPLGLTLSLGGGDIVADTGNHRLVFGDTTVGSQGSGVNQFNRPEGVAIGQERVYPERQISRIEVQPTSLSLAVGETIQVAGRGFDEQGTLSSIPEDWKWRSEDSNIAEVDAPVSGIYRAGNPVTIRAKAVGRTNIIVFNITAKGGSGNSITIPVEVRESPTGGINVPVR